MKEMSNKNNGNNPDSPGPDNFKGRPVKENFVKVGTDSAAVKKQVTPNDK